MFCFSLTGENCEHIKSTLFIILDIGACHASPGSPKTQLQAMGRRESIRETCSSLKVPKVEGFWLQNFSLLFFLSISPLEAFPDSLRTWKSCNTNQLLNCLITCKVISTVLVCIVTAIFISVSNWNEKKHKMAFLRSRLLKKYIKELNLFS